MKLGTTYIEAKASMTEKKKEDEPKKKTLGLKGGTLSLKAGAGAAKPSGGTVVEVRRRRAPAKTTEQQANEDALNLTSDERSARARALEEALKNGDSKSSLPPPPSGGPSATELAKEENAKNRESAEDARKRELEELQRIEAQEKAHTATADKQNQQRFQQQQAVSPSRKAAEEAEKLKRTAKPSKNADDRRRGGKITVTQVLNKDYDRDRSMSMAAQKRAREKARLAMKGPKEDKAKVFREVTVPEHITVQELANRMTERSVDVIKELMKLGIMATTSQTIDADTAELVVEEFGHTIKRVTESDIEVGVQGIQDDEKDLLPRPPVVTIMGHVDHGKTSLLDAMRQTDVVAGEAGGITQHIGAYQIENSKGDKITFLDTPGHAAFTEMRSRGANVTDIVVLVVSAADSIMPQTVEAINHAKAAGVPIIVAINKIDLPGADAHKVRNDLLQHEVITEEVGGDVMAVEISAKNKTNLDALEDAIMLQAEILELKANPNRNAQGAVIESKMEKGRGSVATILVQNGTLKVGDTFVVGAEFGKVRAIIDDKGKQIKQAIAGQPVEVLGLNGTPASGDVMNVLDDEAKAREIAEHRADQIREKSAAAVNAGRTMENMFAISQAEGIKKTLAIVIKGDVHGSVEAIIGSLNKMTEGSEEIGVQILHSGVGGITESDVTLATASNAMLIGFNVRANAQARMQADKEGLDIRYYNIIYDVIDDAKAILGGMLDPSKREEYLGQAEIREVFNISKFGKIAGCMVTTGSVKRGAKVRLLRDDVVIHEGTLKTLKRFKDEVKEVKESTECGMAFEGYDDIKEKDIIECFEIVEEARTLD